MYLKKVFFDFGRTNVQAVDMTKIYLDKFPEEAKWEALAVRNFYEANFPFPNDAPYIEPVRDIPLPSADEIKAVIDAATKAKEGVAAIAFVASGSAYTAAKAGIDFLTPLSGAHKPEIVFLGCVDDKKYHETEMKKLAGKKFSVCVVEDGNMPAYTKSAAEEVTALLKKDGGGTLFTAKTTFKGPDAIFSQGSLFMLAVCGYDINEVVNGAKLDPLPDMDRFVSHACTDAGLSKSEYMPPMYNAIRYYSLTREVLVKQGHDLEFFTWADPRFEALGSWCNEIFNQYDKTTGIEIKTSSITNASAIDKGSEGKKPFITLLYTDSYKSLPDYSDKVADDKMATNKDLQNDFQTKKWASKVPVLRIGLPDISAFAYGNFAAFFLRVARISTLWN